MNDAKRWLLPLTLGFLTTASCGSDDGCDGNNYDSDCMRLLGGATLDHYGTCK